MMHKLTSGSTLFYILCICAFSLIINVGTYGVIETSDARYAEISREMFESGDYIHPTLLGIKHYHKPPLTYYITALGYFIFGVNSFGARFFIQLSILIQIVFVYRISKLLFNDEKTALWSSLIYFSMPIILVSSRNLTTDAYLTTFIILSMYAWIKYRKTGWFKYLYWFAVYTGLGFLSKGPLIFIVPVIFIIAYNFVKSPKNKLGYHHALAGILFLAIAGSWFFILLYENTDLIKYFFWHHTIERFASDIFERGAPFWYYFAVAPVIGLPWLFLLPFMLWKNRKTVLKSNIGVVLLIGIIVPFLFFSSASSKLVPYILPLFSLFAILTAHLIRQFGLKKHHYIVIMCFAGLLAISGILATFILSAYTIPYSILFLSVLLCILTFVISKYGKPDYSSKTIYIAYACSLFILIGSGSLFSKNQIEVNSTYPLSCFIKENKLEDREILVYNWRAPSISFHLQKSIISLYDGDASLNREVQFQNNEIWKENLINLQNDAEVLKLKEKLNKEHSVLIIYKNRLPEKKKWLLHYYDSKKDLKKWQIYY